MAVLISALVASVNPALWPWVAAAVGLVLLAQFGGAALGALKEHDSAARVAAVGATGIALLATVSTLLVLGRGDDASDGGRAGPQAVSVFLELPVGYSVTAHYMGEGGEALRLDERMTLTAAALEVAAEDLLTGTRQAGRRSRDEEERFLAGHPERRAAAIREDLRTLPGVRADLELPPAPEAFRLAVPNLDTARRRLVAALARELREDGWTLEVDNNRRQVFARTDPRRKLDRGVLLPAERTNELEAAAPALEAELVRHPLHGAPVLDISLAFDDRSAVSLERMPENAVGETFPDATRATHPGDGSEDVTFGLEESARAETVEFEVRSPPFRNAILVQAVDLSVWSGMNWILVGLIAASSEWVRGLPRRLLARLRGRTRAPGPRRRRARGWRGL